MAGAVRHDRLVLRGDRQAVAEPGLGARLAVLISGMRPDSLAIYIPIQSPVVERLQERVLGALRAAGSRFEAQAPEHFHCTLLYLDSFPRERVPELLTDWMLPPPFTLEAVEVTTFPDAESHPVILRLAPSPSLLRIQSDLARRAQFLGVQLSPYSMPGAYQPHLTLAYDVDPMPEAFPQPETTLHLPVQRVTAGGEHYEPYMTVILPASIGDRPFVTVHKPNGGAHGIVGRGVSVGGLLGRVTKRGGPGSGHFGHEGRPGELGGSQPGEGGGKEVVVLHREIPFYGPAVSIKVGADTYGLTEIGRMLAEHPNLPEEERRIAIRAVAQRLTKKNLGEVLQWSTSRYNEYSKAEAVNIALRILREGTERFIMTSGSYTPATAMTGSDYLIDGPGGFIASGSGGFQHDVSGFKERARWYFYGTPPLPVARGGPGSGHFEHEGRPGEVGGSLPGAGSGTDLSARISAEDVHRLRREFAREFRRVNPRTHQLEVSGIRHSSRLRSWIQERGGFGSVRIGTWAWLEIESERTGGWLIFRDGESEVAVAMLDDPNEILIRNIEARPRGSGLGTRVMRALADYADMRGADLTVYAVANPSFFNRFSGWTSADGSQYTRRLADAYRMDHGDYEALDRAEEAAVTERGGPGSGHFEHEGRPGEVGGSLPSSGSRDAAALESELISRWGAADLMEGTWIGPSGQALVPHGDHQRTAWELFFPDEPYPEGAGHPGAIEATNMAIRAGLVRYNIASAVGYGIAAFDVPRQETLAGEERQAMLTDEQRSSMAAIVTNLTRQWGRVPFLAIGFGGMHDAYGAGMTLRGEAAFEFLGLDETDLAEVVKRGGPGSGHFGHEGRPGEVGGSLPSGAVRVADSWRAIIPEETAERIRSELGELVGGIMAEDARILIGEEFWIDSAGRLYPTSGMGHEGSAKYAIGYVENLMIEPPSTLARIAIADPEAVMHQIGFLRLSRTAGLLALSFSEDNPPTDDQLHSVYATVTADEMETVLWEVRHLPLPENGWMKFTLGASGFGITDLLAYLRGSVDRGGPGSGHFGHEGRPGEVGGSQPSEGGPGYTTFPEGPDSWAMAQQVMQDQRRKGGFGVLVENSDGSVTVWTNRQPYIDERLRYFAKAPLETIWCVDNLGRVDLQDILGRNVIEIEGEAHSVSFNDTSAERIRESARLNREPVVVHNHPGFPGTERSSPPSDKDLELSFYERMPHQLIVAWDGYYELRFGHIPDGTEREVWNQNADIYNEDHPASQGMREWMSQRPGAERINPPADLVGEAYESQHGRLEYISSQMPDLFTYRFVPWPK